MTTEQQKHEYLDEHLPYMLKMVRYTYGEMLQPQSYLSFNAHFESFAVNARNLANFLTNADTGNFKSCEFAEGFKARKDNVAGLTQKLEQQVFHVAKNRPRYKADGKFDTGDAKPVLDWIEKNFREFLDALPQHLRKIFNEQKAEPEKFIRWSSNSMTSTSAESIFASFTGPGPPPKAAEESAD
jgi:hypothetical protein